MPDNFETYTREYADAAGLRATDMPSSHHPLLESDEEIRELSDLIDARDGSSSDPMSMRALGIDDTDLDVDAELTTPRIHRQSTSADRAELLSDMDADALTPSDPDDEDDSSYMTRADFEQEMDDSDPDPNAGMDRNDYLGDAGIDRAPDMSGTVRGIARGMSTHLPQDLGADGFQILEPEDLERSLIDEDEEEILANIDPNDPDGPGDVIPTHAEAVTSKDDALDASRRLK